jgi:hypothetical protein
LDQFFAPQNDGIPIKDQKKYLNAGDYRELFKLHFLPCIEETFERDGETPGRSKKFIWQDDHDNKHTSAATRLSIIGLIGEDQ